MNKLPTNNSEKMAPGYIWIMVEDETADHMPPGYLVQRMGGVGYYARLDACLPNGYSIIPVSQYPSE